MDKRIAGNVPQDLPIARVKKLEKKLDKKIDKERFFSFRTTLWQLELS